MTHVAKRGAFCMAAVLVLAGALAKVSRSETPVAWDIGDPIVTYWNGPGTLLWGEHFGPLDDASARQLVQGGFNVALVNSYQEVEIAQRHGLRTMFQSELLIPASLDDATQRTALDAMIQQLRRSAAHYAYALKDEPNASEFAGLGRLVAYLREHDPDHLAYINLLPNYASNAQLAAEGYPAYVRQFTDTVHPTLLSYDHYQLTTAGDSPRYLENLQAIAQAARQSGVPFLNGVQACSWDPAAFRVPNAEETRFLIYSTLAYGAQGIAYFQYTQADAPQIGGIVKRDGTPMAVYPAIQAGNREFVNVAKQCRSQKWIGAYLKGYGVTTPPGTSPLPDHSPFDVGGVSNDLLYKEGNPLKRVLLGLFGPKGDSPTEATLAMVVNLDYSAAKQYTVIGPGDLSVFNAANGTWTALDRRQATLDFPPGGGLLVGLTSATATLPAHQ